MPTRGEIAANFDGIADEFDAARPRPWRETIAFERELPPRSRVLDLGCGSGRNVAFLAERGHPIAGLDASAQLLKLAAAKVGRSALVRADAVALPFSAATFDAVHCVATLHHLPSETERRQVVREIVRVLRPGGPVLLSVWALEQERFQSTVGEHVRKGDAAVADVSVPWRRSDGRVVPRFYHLFHEGELEGLMPGALAVVRAWREGDNHVLLVAKR